jgi:hypothetical protein
VKGWQKRHSEIKEKLIAQTGKRALLVEGTDDVSLFRILLTRKLGAGWENDWVLAYTGKKEFVVDILAQENDWLGIVDRDEWTDEVITEKQRELTNLFVLPRFCIENYAIDPDELWEALPPKMQGKVVGGLNALKSEILRDKVKWLRHGVLWSVINPLWSGLRALGFKEKLLKINAVQDNDTIKITLTEWHDYLEPGKVFQSFVEKLNQVSVLPEKDQLHRWIHGKQFFSGHVHSVLNNYLGQHDAQSRKIDIFRSCVLPQDLNPLWAMIQHQ